MPSTVPPRHPRRPLPGRRSVGVLLAGALALGFSPAPDQARAAETTAEASDFTMIQANILSQLSVERFQADVREVLAEKPDLVTYNEVPWRQDSVLAPGVYDIHRSMRNRYTKQTAVAWRTDRFTEVASGTVRISNYRRRPAGRNIKLGIRFANWVTLGTPDGRRLSVVAVHVAPNVPDMPNLLRPTVRKIGALVSELAPSGPVLVGGDFNVHYRSGSYPRDLFDEAEMVPTYDALGTYFPTGDHRGATIDYIFNRGAGQLAPDWHSKFELNSDHDAVQAGFSWQVDPPTDTQQVVSDPTGDAEARRRVVAAIVREFRTADPGSQVDVVTSGFGPRRMYRKARRAVARGVQVRLVTRSETLTKREQKLAEYVRESGRSGSAVRRCVDDCRARWRDSGMARGFLLVRDDRGRAVKRMDVDRPLSPTALGRRTTLTVRTGEIGLARGEEMLAAIS